MKQKGRGCTSSCIRDVLFFENEPNEPNEPNTSSGFLNYNPIFEDNKSCEKKVQCIHVMPKSISKFPDCFKKDPNDRTGNALTCVTNHLFEKNNIENFDLIQTLASTSKTLNYRVKEWDNHYKIYIKASLKTEIKNLSIIVNCLCTQPQFSNNNNHDSFIYFKMNETFSLQITRQNTNEIFLEFQFNIFAKTESPYFVVAGIIEHKTKIDLNSLEDLITYGIIDISNQFVQKINELRIKANKANKIKIIIFDKLNRNSFVINKSRCFINTFEGNGINILNQIFTLLDAARGETQGEAPAEAPAEAQGEAPGEAPEPFSFINFENGLRQFTEYTSALLTSYDFVTKTDNRKVSGDFTITNVIKNVTFNFNTKIISSSIDQIPFSIENPMSYNVALIQIYYRLHDNLLNDVYELWSKQKQNKQEELRQIFYKFICDTLQAYKVQIKNVLTPNKGGAKRIPWSKLSIKDIHSIAKDVKCKFNVGMTKDEKIEKLKRAVRVHRKKKE